LEDEKIRADRLLARRGMFPSREKAAQAIAALRVTVDGRLITKPSAPVPEGAKIEVAPAEDYVGRGALKLKYALDAFGIDLTGRVCIDVGASTGGFTEIMLRCGAAKVYAVDVGSSQLSEKLSKDGRVVNMEKTDIRDVSREYLLPRPDFCVVDVSFISLSYVLPHCLGLVDGNECVALIKPQFEAGRPAVGKSGVVKDIRVHKKVLGDIIGIAQSLGVNINGIVPSPIAGKSGNREYLIRLGKTKTANSVPDIEALVSEAFKMKD
jgi:23S rRNA (cytidine1920-2'-O)/16S rRNA (cytidine1409-2'-O)-methyltransferase